MRIEKLTLPITILLSAIVLAGGYYAVQYNKQQSIEKQQRIELQQDRCNALSSGVKEKWSNVMGVNYNDFWKECVVTFTDTKTGEVKTSPLRLMKTIK